MYFTDDSLLPENQAPLMITAAPYGPMWLPGDCPGLPVTWEEQVQAAVDCQNAGATLLHIQDFSNVGRESLSPFVQRGVWVR